MKYLFALVGLTLFGFVAAQEQGQVSLGLDDCLEIALERNLSIKQARNNELIAKANQFQSLMNYLPGISGEIDYSWTIGNFFDQTAARQVTATTETSAPFIGASVNLFSGFDNHYLRNQRSSELAASEAATADAELNTKANIMGFYLNTILGE
jgi:outer membrane protein